MTMPKLIGKLPAEAEALLKAAASVGEPGSKRRIIAIEEALARANDLHPEHFQQGKTNVAKIEIQNVRTSFLNVFEATSMDGSKPAFNGKFIVPPNHPQIAAIEKAMLDTAIEKWGAKGKTIFDNMTKVGKKPDVGFIKEPYKNKDGEPYDGFDGMFYVSAKNTARPTLIDRDNSILVEADGKPYSGCYVNVIIEFWAQDNSYGRAIRATLKGMRFVGDGDSFQGGAPASVDEFAPVSEGSDAGDLA